MSATQVIAEMERLPKEEWEKVVAYLRERAECAQGGDQVDDRFRKMADEIFTENAELFRKLAQ